MIITATMQLRWLVLVGENGRFVPVDVYEEFIECTLVAAETCCLMPFGSHTL